MKLLLLNVLAAAIACSSLNFAAQSKAQENNQKPLLQNVNNRYDEGGGFGDDNLPTYYDDDEIYPTDDEPCTAIKIGEQRGKIKGSLYSNGYYMDEDWFIFTNQRKSAYTFSIEVSDSSYNFEVYRFEGDINRYFPSQPSFVCGSNSYSRSRNADLMPGSYFIRIFYSYQATLNPNIEYTFKYTSTQYSDYSISPEEHIDPLADGCEIFVWENDLIPINVDRWGVSSYHLYRGNPTGTEFGYLDPIFMKDGFGQCVYYSQDSLDSVIYIFDKTAIQELYDNCEHLIDYIQKINNLNLQDQLNRLKIQNIKTIGNNVTGAISFGFSVAATAVGCVPGAQAVALGLGIVSLVFSTPSLGHAFCDTFLHPDLSHPEYPVTLDIIQHNVDVLHNDCAKALRNENYGIKLEKFSKLYDKYGEASSNDNIYWLTSSFENKSYFDKDPADGLFTHYIVDKTEQIDSAFDFVDYKDVHHYVRGTIKYYKDMDEFSSKTNFSFGSDIPTGVAEPFSGEGVTNCLKSIELSGNYQTSFTAGDRFTTNGMWVKINYTNQASRSIQFNYSKDDILPQGFNVNFTDINMNAQGVCTVLVSYTEGFVTKHAKYKINIGWETETRYAYAFFDFYGRDLTYFSGHGSCWYYLDTYVPIPDVTSEELNSVVVVGQSFGDNALEIFDFQADPSGLDGTFRVHLKTHQGWGHGYIYIYFRYDGIVPFEERPELQSLSLSGDYKTKVKLGQQFDTNGLVVTAHYNDGTEANVTSNCSIVDTEVNTLYMGTYPVYVSYTERNVTKSITYYVEVGFAHLESISLSGNYQRVFELGEPFNCNGLEVYVGNSFGESVLLEDNEYTLNSLQYNPYVPGTYNIFVSYTENSMTVSDSYSVEVLVPELESVELIGNYRTTFEVGEAFDHEGLSLLATYVNGYSVEITNFTVDSDNVDMSEAGFYEVLVSYEINGVTGTLSYFVDVDEPYLESISLSGVYQTSFTVGDSFNTNGLIVTAHYSNGTSQEIYDYSVDLTSVNMNEAGTYQVVVHYTENGVDASASYNIRVKPVKVEQASLQSITLSGNYLTLFARGSTFNWNGLIVTANYSDGTSQEVKNYTVNDSMVNMNKAGSYPVIVSYTENGVTVSATYTVTVLKLIRPIFDGDDPIPFPGGKF